VTCISIPRINAVTHARHSQVIIINKIDLMTPEEVQSLSAFIRTFNAVAKIVETQRSRVPLADVVNSRVFSMQRAEKMKGWLARARGDVQPESEEYTFASLSQALPFQLDFSSLSAHVFFATGTEFRRSCTAPAVPSTPSACTQLSAPWAATAHLTAC
jgi:G3E family GTPase